ncbi:MAG: hypothetical protein NC191_02180 [Muribaculaceae bacterium]|nr:hypothetical protein [Muribaculaceae bacterium]
MKKISLAVLGLAMVTSASLSASAIELKAPGLSAVKSPTTQSAKTDKNAANEKYQKEYQAKIEAQQKKLNAIKAEDRNARLQLANVILTGDKIAEIKALSDAEIDEALDSALVAALSDETFHQVYAEESFDKTAYYNAVKAIKNVDNKYKNISNELTAPLKAIVDGNVSAISAKDELKNAGALILGIKKNLGTSSSVKKAINKVNKAENIVVVPDVEVIYPQEGVIGSINYNLNEIDKTVRNANQKIAKVLLTEEQRSSLSAINNNQDLSKEERNAQLRLKTKEYFEANQTDGTIKKAIDTLTPAQKEEFTNAASEVIGAAASYGALGMQCTKLGFNISKNPLLAAPLAFEMGALKDTAGLIKEGSSNLAKSVSQLKKVMKDNGLAINTQTTNVKTTGLKNIKPVNNLKK